MRKKISVLAAVLLAIGLTACGNNTEEEEVKDSDENGVLVVYFYATGTTKDVSFRNIREWDFSDDYEIKWSNEWPISVGQGR